MQQHTGQPDSLLLRQQQRASVLQAIREHRAKASALKHQGVGCPELVSAAHLEQAWTPPQQPGKIAGIQIGDIFRNRAELMLVGLHGSAFQDVHASREGHVLSLVLTPPPDVDPTNEEDHGCESSGGNGSSSQDGEDGEGGLGQPPLDMHGRKGRGKAGGAKLEGAQGVGSGWDGESTEHWTSDGGSGYKYHVRGGLRLENEVSGKEKGYT
ncbi:hypothetical protein DUNSADRAFT_8989 [Dunaliella salina]|uniref:Encoded protein n=1 Tax=Dunaliella salina TaxID=3046 RepID=A0ABQ7GIE0_DUNSA|nr:hypothetical protein DUNSADRAFT_8989 [Dunaliella salina]|eukprot:KAF5834366.1 hypothetical protein DUNSADRAFT_8989 [Dunaliella salina]